MSQTVHVAIVSEQALANLVPALMWRPDRVYLATSDRMQERGMDLRHRAVLEQVGIHVEIVPGLPEADLASIREYVDALGLKVAEAESAEIIYNITGGTKLMALAFYQTCAWTGGRAISTDTRSGRIEFPSEEREAQPTAAVMDSVLDVDLFLAAQGAARRTAASDDAEWRERADARKAAAKHLGQHAQRLGGLFGDINRAAGLALRNDPKHHSSVLEAPIQTLSSAQRGQRLDALEMLAAHGLLQLHSDRKIEFIDVERTEFLCGHWLEEYVWHLVRDAGPTDVRCSQRISWRTGPAANEIDLIATHDNRALFCECTTSKLAGVDGQTKLRKFSSVIQPLRSPLDQAWLLTTRPLNDDKQGIARRNQLEVFGPDRLPNLKEHVQAWLAGAGVA